MLKCTSEGRLNETALFRTQHRRYFVGVSLCRSEIFRGYGFNLLFSKAAPRSGGLNTVKSATFRSPSNGWRNQRDHLGSCSVKREEHFGPNSLSHFGLNSLSNRMIINSSLRLPYSENESKTDEYWIMNAIRIISLIHRKFRAEPELENYSLESWLKGALPCFSRSFKLNMSLKTILSLIRVQNWSKMRITLS